MIENLIDEELQCLHDDYETLVGQIKEKMKKGKQVVGTPEIKISLEKTIKQDGKQP